MMKVKTLENRVAKSALESIKLLDLYPEGKRISLDLKNYLWKGLVLKEKAFRKALNEIDLTNYKGSFVNVFCSTDAILPYWSYMLVATQLSPFVSYLFLGTAKAMEEELFKRQIDAMDLEKYRDKRLVINGCAEEKVPACAYFYLTAKLLPIAKSIFYGEPCSTVPVYKRK